MPIRLTGNLKSNSSNLLSYLEAQNKDITAATQTLLTGVRLRLRRRINKYWKNVFCTEGNCNYFKTIIAVPPGIANVSKDQVICEGSLVTLSCNATGRPTPTITWRKVEDNGTDSAPLLPVVDGKYVLSNIQQSANGTYRCTANNRVGVPANRTASVKVECKSSFLYSCDFNFQTSWCCIGNTAVYDVSYTDV